MFYYLYEVKNKISGKIYVGVHKTHNLDDGYMGSGKVIQRSIEKNGIENFTKTILEHFDSSEEMYAREKEVVTEEFLDRDDTYNLRRGGNGGFDYINKAGLADYKKAGAIGKAKQSQLMATDDEWRQQLGASISRGRRVGFLSGTIKSNMTDELRIKMVEWAHTPESNQKRLDTMRKNAHQSGTKNSQFGSIWITNGTESKKMKKTDPIPEGYRLGRK